MSNSPVFVIDLHPSPLMTMEQMVEGVRNAECKQELESHLSLISKRLDRDDNICCVHHWNHLRALIRRRSNEFRARVYH